MTCAVLSVSLLSIGPRELERMLTEVSPRHLSVTAVFLSRVPPCLLDDI